jgi:alanine dehydrogenase
MRIGVPKERQDNEYRVGITPDGARVLAAAGHALAVEHGAGVGCGFADADYAAAGAALVDVEEAWNAELVVKVKEPIESEHARFTGQTIFTYFHLSGAPRTLTEALLETGTTAVAYETVEDASGRLPLLAPMSAVAGSMAPLVGAHYLASANGGRGTLLGKILGVRYGRVVIVGDGIVGMHACSVASALGAEVVVFGITPERAPEFEKPGNGVRYALSSADGIAAKLRDADLLIGAVLLRGAAAPHVVSEGMIAGMPSGAVAVDVSIDQGGCIATSRPTKHSSPVFVKHGVIHYCVTNMPGAYPRTSTLALTEATLPYVLRLAAGGVRGIARDAGFAKGVNIHRGRITYRAVAETFDLLSRYRELADVLA